MRTAGAGPLDAAYAFWKPLIDADELAALATYIASDVTPATNCVQAIASADAARTWRLVMEGEAAAAASDDATGTGAARAGSVLFAAVHAIPEVPAGAESLAEVRDETGTVHSHVLWYPERRCVVVPFDPQAAIEALRLERYQPKDEHTVLPAPVLSAYYRLKPLLPRPLRMLLRRSIAHTTQENDHVLDWPADMSLDDLMRLLLRAVMLASGRDELEFAWFWPHGHPWAAILTHDVETAAGLAAVPHVMEIESARGHRSSFNIVANDYAVPISAVEAIHKKGFEPGVHGFHHDGLMFMKYRTFLKRAEKVNAQARAWGSVGFRSPATYRNPDWFSDLAFEYDSSFTDTAPFEPQPGGCASVFPYLIGDVVEMPMTLPQDHTLFALLGHTDAGVWLDKLGKIERVHGMACVLTHPDPAEGYIGVPENEERYLAVLNRIAASEAWRPLPRELARWWRARDAAELGQLPEVEGARAGCATLAVDGSCKITPPEVS